jgi:hypothetical protein
VKGKSGKLKVGSGKWKVIYELRCKMKPFAASDFSPGKKGWFKSEK